MGRGKQYQGGCGCFNQRQQRHVEPSILFLLWQRPRHGYELMADLPELGFFQGNADPGAVYRMLRHLEEFELVTSAWDTTGSGPAKRLYTVTDAGKKQLQQWQQSLIERRDALEHFINSMNSLFLTEKDSEI